MKKCPLRPEKAIGTKNLIKRGISDTDMGGTEEVFLEPPQKVLRLSVVSIGNGNIDGFQDGVNRPNLG